MNNVANGFFAKYQGVTPQLAGIAASMFGLMNLFARSLGGLLSDYCNTRWGMRGRLWSCWIIQTLEGIMCLVLGSLTTSLDAPYPSTMTQVPAFVNLPAESWRVAIGAPYGWTPLNGNGCVSSETVLPCGSKQIKATAELKSCLRTQETLILVQDPPYGTMLIDGVNTTIGTSNADTELPNECISHANLFSVAVIIVIIFSVFVQMAEGLHFGIVPYVSRPALGIVSGMVGAGGNLGSVIATNIFFKGAFRTDVGVVNLGGMIIGITMLMFFISFPEHGSMLFKKGVLKYDPQLVKPPADYRGSDQMDYGKVALMQGHEGKSAKVVPQA